MRYGIISDVHSNFEALTACLDVLDRQRIDRLVCLGDTVGYGAEPNQCCDIVRERAAITVMGNHDAAVIGRLDRKTAHDAAQRAIDFSFDALSPRNRTWLATLPYTHVEDGVCFSHGSPLIPEQFDYVFSLDKAATLTGAFDELAPVTFVGHSHLTTAYLVTERMSLQLYAPRVKLRRRVKYLFNVGSVGQPRDHDTRASCVIYDSQQGVVSYLRVAYDLELAAAKIVAAELPASFGQRLYQGV